MVLSINPLWINRRCLFVVLYLIICKSGGGFGVFFLKYFCYFRAFCLVVMKFFVYLQSEGGDAIIYPKRMVVNKLKM